MNLYKLLTALTLTLALSLTALAQTELVPELKGDKLGITLKEWAANHKIDPANSIKVNEFDLVVFTSPEAGNAITIAGTEAVVYYVFKRNLQSQGDSVLFAIRATFSKLAANTVAAGLEDKYGKPTSTATKEMRTRMNVPIESIHTTWKLPNDNLILLESVGDNIDTARLTMTNLINMREVQKLKTKAASTDI
jgi:hypothetical protein